jgi:uncharacterized membrane protein YheB (UPF0754 family)
MTSSDWVTLTAIPLISALIGWITNYVAVKMIFRPRKPWKFLGITIQGLIPRRQHELALKLGETVEKKLVSHKDVQQVLLGPESTRLVLRLIEGQIDTFMTQRLANNPLIAMFVKNEAVDNIKRLLIEQLEGNIPELMEKLIDGVEDQLDFREIIREKVEAFDLGTLEGIIYDISSRELKAIEYLGGVLGLIIGLVQALIVVLSQRGAI